MMAHRANVQVLTPSPLVGEGGSEGRKLTRIELIDSVQPDNVSPLTLPSPLRGEGKKGA